MISFPVHEEHGQVLATWQALGLQRATVVCFDRHLDLKALTPHALSQLDRAAAGGGDLAGLNRPIPFQEDASYAYGLDNFILAAARVGILGRFIWVHPEPTPLDSHSLAKILWDRLSLVAGHGDRIVRTFRVRPEASSAEVGGILIQITTPRRLAALGVGCETHLDIDLDFFATEQGKLLHQPGEIFELLNSLGLVNHDPTLTWSITSGFLPETFEWVGNSFASRLGRTIRPRQQHALAPRAMKLLGTDPGGGAEAIERVIAEELEPLGAPGLSLAAVMALHADPANRDAAIAYWHRARMGGDGASWPAYAIGLASMREGDYTAAAQWFARGAGDQVDTIQLHGSCMRAICLARINCWEEALALALELAKVVPMRREPWTIARSAAIALDLNDLARTISEATPQFWTVNNVRS